MIPHKSNKNLYLKPTQADVEEMVVLGAFGSETGAVHDGASKAHRTEVKLKSLVQLHVCEQTVTETQTVLLKCKTYNI